MFKQLIVTEKLNEIFSNNDIVSDKDVDNLLSGNSKLTYDVFKEILSCSVVDDRFVVENDSASGNFIKAYMKIDGTKVYLVCIARDKITPFKADSELCYWANKTDNEIKELLKDRKLFDRNIYDDYFIRNIDSYHQFVNYNN